MARHIGLWTAIAAIGFATPGSAATMIDFETNGVTHSVYPYYTMQGFTDSGYFFSNNSDIVDIGTGAPWEQGAVSGNFALLNDYGGELMMTKAGGGNFDLASFFIKGWYGSTGDQTLTAWRGGTIVSQFNYQLGADWTKIMPGLRNIDAVSLNTDRNIVLVDDISIAAAVPEPASWAMMILGFGMIGWAMRRRANSTMVA